LCEFFAVIVAGISRSEIHGCSSHALTGAMRSSN
jgi:hypothetical protein